MSTETLPTSKPFWKTITFWISATTWAALVTGHYAGITRPPYGLVLANGVSVCYAILRCLQKRKDGIPWKSIFTTSEFIATAGTVLLNLLESLSKIPSLPSWTLAVLSGASSGLLYVLHSVNGTVKPGTFGVPYSPTPDEIARQNNQKQE